MTGDINSGDKVTVRKLPGKVQKMCYGYIAKKESAFEERS